MGYLLKEALKTLCGVDRWSYAVFWKINCQNPKLLVWEDCYYEPVIYSAIHGIPGSMNQELDFQNWSTCWASNSVSQTGEKVQLLLNKMMVENQFSVVGEGLVGKAAATGNHQWVLSEGYCRDAHPVEVLKELSLQFSAGMQTIAAIPVLPHGVVQLGSSKMMLENVGVVNEVKMLVGQLGCVLISDEQGMRQTVQSEVCPGQTLSSLLAQDCANQTFSQSFLDNLCQPNVLPLKNLCISPKNPDMWPNQHSSSAYNHHSNAVSNGHPMPIIPDMYACSSELDRNMGVVENDLFQELGSVLTRSTQKQSLCGPTMLDFSYDEKDESGTQSVMLDDGYEDPCVHSSGDDLFDVLGADFKHKLLNGRWNGGQEGVYTKDMDPDASSIVNQAKSESGVISANDFNHILDFVTSTHSGNQSLDDNVSCHTTLTTMSSSSGPNASCSYGRVGASSQMQGELFGCPKSKSRIMASCSFDTTPQASSMYGSQVSSWIEQACDMKKTTSVSTVSSKKPDESAKPSRKRLKPGENPRPRPKDRQMIQDRVKELREIVPNGAKCSIDALLERTIKHMLFLQSVTKHADKLKQTGESKIIGKGGGLHFKDNFEGGATWAYEIGTESTMCPIIVEDLNQPRQMLVEMLCEQNDYFLEIADIIRGLGLTILKGVMEMKNEKIWARFAVEANKDITRVEIFMSLVNLFKQTTISCDDSDDEGKGPMLHQPNSNQ
ncbi:unnamed protein product [Cuscuta campestris]|uniref:BHLH domain-containing protein n=1 Tax=Cuscuta campestris TaxID=132261 RepID=A0A484N2R0_9ASTE|nr:unnamed protein product [Cuscuta campestris]